jgi:hypothetical protein
MRNEKYEVQLPTYAICYLEYGETSGLEEEDIKNIDSWAKEYYDRAEELNGNVVFDYADDAGFNHFPDFGLACDTITCTVNILY